MFVFELYFYPFIPHHERFDMGEFLKKCLSETEPSILTSSIELQR